MTSAYAPGHEAEAVTARAGRVTSPVTPFHQDAAVMVGEAGEQAEIPPFCRQKSSQEYCRLEKSILWRPLEKSSFPMHLAGSLEQIHSLCQPRGAPPLAVLPPAVAHTLLLLIVRRRQQRALFWAVCGCPKSRGLYGNCFCTGRCIWQ